MKTSRPPISARYSSHAPDRLKSLRQMKRTFASLFFDPERFRYLTAKQSAGYLALEESKELGVLQKLRRWKCDCLDCEKL